MNRISVSPEAIDNIDEHALYIARDNLDAAYRFIDATEQMFPYLARFPQMGSAWESEDPLHEGVRKITVPGFRKYLIFYRVLEKEIEILHIYHCSRNIRRLF